MANPLYGQNKADDKLDSARAANDGGYTAIGATATLSSDNAGVVIITTSGSAISITLPAHEKGLTFHFIQTDVYDTAVVKVLSADGNDWLGNINAVTGVGDVAASTDDYVQFGSGTLAGDSFSIVSSGSKWIVFNSFSSVTTNGVVFGAT